MKIRGLRFAVSGTTQSRTTDPGPVLIFDGDCAMCSLSVRFVLMTERAPTLRFATLGSDEARALLTSHGRDPAAIDSLTLIEPGLVRTKSAAAVGLTAYLRVPWRWLGLIGIVPRCVLDPLYSFVARNRYRVLGRADRCEIEPRLAGRML